MKNILLSILLMAFFLPLFSQPVTPNTYSRHDDYMLKSKKKRRAGIILLSAGAAVTAGGIILLADGTNRSWTFGNSRSTEHDVEIVTGFIGTIIGVGAMAASIPFFVGARRSRRKALAVSLKTECAPTLYGRSLMRQSYPSLALQIPLGNKVYFSLCGSLPAIALHN